LFYYYRNLLIRLKSKNASCLISTNHIWNIRYKMDDWEKTTWISWYPWILRTQICSIPNIRSNGQSLWRILVQNQIIMAWKLSFSTTKMQVDGQDMESLHRFLEKITLYWHLKYWVYTCHENSSLHSFDHFSPFRN